MKVQKDTFLIRVQSDRNADIGITGDNGKKIIIDVDYNKYKHTMQVGRIYACPIRMTEEYRYDTELSVGDTVVFHHFVCQQDHKIEEGIYRAEYFHLYGIIENEKLIPLEDIIFVEPIMESEDNLYAGKIRIKTFQENLKQTGIVFAASKTAKAMGVLEGDKIFFTASADYQIKVLDKNLYRMRIRNIIAVERDGALVCLENKVLVREIAKENKTGIFTDVNKSHQTTGVVEQVGSEVQGVKAGDVISYYNGALGNLDYGGATYAFLELRNINYIIE